MAPAPGPKAFRIQPVDPGATRRDAVRLLRAADAGLLALVLAFAVSPVATFVFGDDTMGALSLKSTIATAIGSGCWAILLVRLLLRRLAAGPVAPASFRSRLSALLRSPSAPLAAFLALSLLAACLSPWPYTAFFGDRIRHEGWVQYLAYAGLFAAVTTVVRGKGWRAVLSIWLAVAAITAVVALGEHLGSAAFAWSKPPYVRSFFINRNHLGYFLCMSIVLSASAWPALPDRSRSVSFGKDASRGPIHPILSAVPFILCVALTEVLIAVLALSRTRGAYLATFAGLIALAILAPARDAMRRWSPLLLAVFVFAAMYVFDPMLSLQRLTSIATELGTVIQDPGSEAAADAGAGRWELWTAAVHFIQQRPFFGWGPDTGGFFLLQRRTEFVDRVHNEYLQVALSVGIPGLLAWLAFLFACLRPALPSLRFSTRRPAADAPTTKAAPVSPEAAAAAAAALAYLVSAFFGNSLTYVAPFLYLLLARCAAEARRPASAGAGASDVAPATPPAPAP